MNRTAWWLFAALAAFVLWPEAVTKFLFLGIATWLAGRALPASAWAMAVTAFAAMLFAGTFLLTPVCASAAVRGAGAAGTPSLPVQLGLLGFGAIWLRAALASPPPLAARVGALRWRFALLWPALLAGVYFLPWIADIAYGGDEHYHFKALVVHRLLGGELIAHGWFTALLVAWLGAGVWIVVKRSAVLRTFVWWAIAALALAACAPWLLRAEALADPFGQDRALRYPASQPWLAAWLWELTRADWGTGVLFGFETLRFTPVLAVLLTGWVLAQEQRWRSAPPMLPLLAVLAVATVPTLLYHGTLLYLELALLPPLVLLVREGRRWLLASPERLAGTNVWWAALTVGFLKDTGIITIGLLWLARAFVQGSGLARRKGLSTKSALAEARVAFVVLGPGLLYLVLRSLHGSRPYSPHFENLLNGGLWWQAARGVAEQFGGFWLPAIVGAVLLVRRRAWARLLAAGVLFGGMGLFHLLEAPRWVGLARFNLLLLPAVIALAWVALGELLAHRTLALAALVALLAGNAALSPVDGTGQRGNWGGSGERWYAYTDCLIELRRLKADARIGIANLMHPYGIGMTLQRLDWWTAEVVNLPVAHPTDAPATLRAALALAAKGPLDFIVFRWEGEPLVAAEHRHAGYARLRDFPSRGGVLTVFAREGSVEATR